MFVVLSGGWGCIAVECRAAEEPVRCSLEHESFQERFDELNRITLSWEPVPGLFYKVQTKANLEEPWGVMEWFWAPADVTNAMPVGCADVNVQARRFYQVVVAPVPDWYTTAPAELRDAAERWRLAYIPPGTFMMGSPPTEKERLSYEGPQTQVTLSEGFWMGRYEVTQAEYLDVTGANPSQNWLPSAPVNCVSWYNATNYCSRLTAREEQAGRQPVGYVFRLPTEAEWEYACRAGTTTAFHYGSALRSGMAAFDGRYEYDAAIGTIQNSEGIAPRELTQGGRYAPNGWGLYDMHGSLWEWCWDDLGPYPGGSLRDPVGYTGGWSHMHRGGRWYGPAVDARSAVRYSCGMDAIISHGFRVVLARPVSGAHPSHLGGLRTRGRCEGVSPSYQPMCH